MAVETVGLSQCVQLPGMEAVSSSGLCGLQILARVLSTLLGREVDAAQVHAKAVGLGLLRCQHEPAVARLSCQSASRLLLAGYHLPAQVEPGRLRAVREYLRLGQQVFAPLAGVTSEEEKAPALYQLHCFHAPDLERPSLSLGRPEAPVSAVVQLPLDRFVEAWTAADGLLIGAAHSWDELPCEGRSFFGGSRDPDGTYYWDVAECVTDRSGRILRVNCR